MTNALSSNPKIQFRPFGIRNFTETNIHCPAIDGLRGIAILMVIAHHVKKAMWGLETDNLIKLFSEKGANGVTLFFVISAITLVRSQNSRAGESPSKFYVRRFFRIFPIWWTYLLVAFFVYRPQSNILLLNIFMLFGFCKGSNFTVLGWSLFVEVCFYLIFPFAYRFASNPLKAFCLLLVSLILSPRTSGWLLVQISPTIAQNYFSFFPVFHLLSFACGLLLIYFVQRFSQPDKFIIYLINGLVPVVWMMTLFDDNHGLSVTLWASLIVLAGSSPGSLVSRILKLRFLSWFGICSYSIYLWHFLILKLLKQVDFIIFVESLFGAGLGAFFVIWITLVSLSLVVGYFSYNFLELKFIFLGNAVNKNLENWVHRPSHVDKSSTKFQTERSL